MAKFRGGPFDGVVIPDPISDCEVIGDDFNCSPVLQFPQQTFTAVTLHGNHCDVRYDVEIKEYYCEELGDVFERYVLVVSDTQKPR